ncbi:MAG: thioredoxin family protein [Acidobacteriota bacterium]
MKKGLLVILLLVCLNLAVVIEAKNDKKTNIKNIANSKVKNDNVSVDWLVGADGYTKAVEQHRNTGKPIALYFYTDWCGYCRRFSSSLLTTTEVQDYMKNVIKIKINPEAGQKERAISNQYGVMGYPTFLIVSNKLSQIERVHPFYRRNGVAFTMKPAEFILACKEASKK